MAITGSGTQADPWIVHSYTEIKTAISGDSYGANQGSVKFYVKLAEDINCNDYGESFQWETIAVPGNSSNYDLDLDGHTIKNFKVKTGNQVFTFGGYQSSKVHNGKILNVFLSGSDGFTSYYNGGLYVTSSYEDMSISINLGSGIDRSVFSQVNIRRCAVYIEGTVKTEILYTILSVTNEITDSDFQFDITMSGTNSNIHNASGSNSQGIQRCRFRGKMNVVSTSRSYLFMAVKDSVVDIETSGNERAYYYLGGGNGGLCSGTVYNSDELTNISYPQGAIAVTSQEMINGASLRAKGFEVVNVTA